MHKLLKLYLLLITSIIFANEGSISGKVQAVSEPLYGANVFLVGTSMGSTTDSSGSYQILGIPVGKYTLQVDYIGYEPASIDLYIAERDEASEELSGSNFSAKLGLDDDDSSDISLSVNKLKKDGYAYEKDKATWLNTDISGDDKHRVLVRDNGKATYFASDVAYHKNKIDRGFDKLINIWGADHHGYIKRIEASIENLGSNKNKLIVKLVQFANLFKDGKKVKMSTRSGEFFTLKNLIEDIGSDAARFYYLSKQADQHLDFDLDLAKSDSKENIFYYIQYAHARIVSLEEKALDKFSKINRNIKNISSGNYKECDNLIHEISKFPDIVNKSANTLQPHVIIYYLKDLSQLFHSFYNDNHVLSESEENIQSILECLIAVKQVISNGLNLLGITPMQKM